MKDLVERLRSHDDERLYQEADELMSEAADEITRLREEIDSLKAQSTEPVAWCHINYEDGGYVDCIQPFKDSFCTTPLFAAAPCDDVETLRRERDDYKQALEKSLSVVPAISECGGFVICHHSLDGEYIGYQNIDPMWVVQDMANIARNALDAARKGEEYK